MHDLLNSAYLTVVKTFFGPLIFLVALVLNGLIMKEFIRRPLQGLWRTLMGIFILGFIIISVLAYPYSSTYFAFIGIISLLFIFTMLLKEYSFPGNMRNLTKRTATPGLIALGLIFFMNDWKVVVECFNNGTILYRWFDNTVYYAILNLNFIVLNAFSHLGQFGRWQWWYLIHWEKDAVRMLIKSYAFVVFVTLYAPTWRGNHIN